MEVSGQRHGPAALPPGKDPRYPLDKRKAGWPSEPVRTLRSKEKSFVLARNRKPAIQLVSRRYADRAIEANYFNFGQQKRNRRTPSNFRCVAGTDVQIQTF
jgi:hypothetical protein